MRRAGHSWSNRRKTWKPDETAAKRIGEILLLAVLCMAFLFYTIPHMQTGARFTASGSASATFDFTSGGRGPRLNLEAVPEAQPGESSSAAAKPGAAESKAESNAESTVQSSAASTAESTAESTAPQSETESHSEIQSTPAQDGDTAKTESTNADAPGNVTETGHSAQSGAES
ncbi:hypothetical protein ACRQV7_04785 [Caproiciproducens sp. R2]|uniref:hypothetical protein n=1 Tax=Caproiciproducens sp. R2 TaxID=3435187 RepID=UPI004034202E